MVYVTRIFLSALLLTVTASFAFDYSNCDMCHKSGGAASASPRGLSASPHAGVGCTECHPGATSAHNKGTYSLGCSYCHTETAESYEKSVHGGAVGITCTSCHGAGHAVSPVNTDEFQPTDAPVICGECHGDVMEMYLASSHGKALSGNDMKSPGCTQCHGSAHETVSVSDSEILSPLEQPGFCADCHAGRTGMNGKSGATERWATGVHGQVNENTGGYNAACVDCHTPHNEQPAQELISNTNYTKVAGTCGKCHSNEYKDFSASVHGRSVAAGIKESPTCIDCHGSHFAVAEFSKNDVVKLCGSCHESPILSAKFGIAADSVDNFRNSEHGVLLHGGRKDIADCADCHTAHSVLPSTDPNAALYGENRIKTCGKCHEDATGRFSNDTDCIIETDGGGIKPTTVVAYIYIFLIVTVIGGMVAHNGLDYFSKLRAIRRERLEKPTVSRLSLVERVQHIILLTSFSLLAFTGLAIKFPAWPVFSWLVALESPFEIRLTLHKIFGVILIVVSVFHIWYLLFTRAGRARLVAIFPRLKDLTDAVRFILHRLGIAKEGPAFDEFNYAEKAEYWALVWGNVVMASTGVYMWLDPYISSFIPHYVYDIMRAVHFYEAVLAILAIIVWHLYFVIVDPFIYPMNFAWFDGKVTEDMLKHEKPAYYEKLKSEGDKPDKKKKPDSKNNDSA